RRHTRSYGDWSSDVCSSDLPVPAQIVIEIRTGKDVTPFQTTMAFLHLLKGLPGAPIGLLVFKKEFQIRSRERGIVFDEDDHVPSRMLDQAPILVIALSRIAGENAPLA